MINTIFRVGEGVGGSRKTNINAAWKVCRSKGRVEGLGKKDGDGVDTTPVYTIPSYA